MRSSFLKLREGKQGGDEFFGNFMEHQVLTTDKRTAKKRESIYAIPKTPHNTSQYLIDNFNRGRDEIKIEKVNNLLSDFSKYLEEDIHMWISEENSTSRLEHFHELPFETLLFPPVKSMKDLIKYKNFNFEIFEIEDKDENTSFTTNFQILDRAEIETQRNVPPQEQYPNFEDELDTFYTSEKLIKNETPTYFRDDNNPQNFKNFTIFLPESNTNLEEYDK